MKLFQKIAAGLLLLCSINTFAGIKPREAKNLFVIIDPIHKHCSPMEGMVWWEFNTIENIYRIGNPDHATTKLVKLLFHLHEDGVFDCTRPPAITLNNGNAPAYFTSEIIAELVYLLETHTTIEQVEAFKTKIKEHVSNFFKRHKTVFPSNGNYTRNLEKIFRLICDSHKECLSANPNAYYQPFTTHNILLGFMWKKSTSKQDFINYLKKLKELNLHIIDPAYANNYEKMLADSYEPTELQQTFNHIHQLNGINLTENYEKIVCTLLANRPFGLVSHASGVKYKDQLFPDCGETSLLNFINLIIYNAVTKRFDLNLLVKEGIILHPKLKWFYEKYPLAEDMNTKQVHDDWAQVVSEIAGVIYRQGGEPYKNNDPKHYCNIAGIGYHQILTILRHLFGAPSLDSFDRLAQLCSREGFILTCTPQDPITKSKMFNTFTFSINDEKAFEWHCSLSHFSVRRLSNSSQMQLLSNAQIKGLLSNHTSHKARSLLAITQSSNVMLETLKEHSNLKLFNFASLIPNIKNADLNCDFMKLLIEHYQQSTQQDEIAELIKRLYGELPEDWQYLRNLSCMLIQNKVEKLYSFIQEKIKNNQAKDVILNTISPLIISTNTQALYDFIEKEILTVQPHVVINFIECIQQNSLKTSCFNYQRWYTWLNNNFSKIPMYSQKQLCDWIKHKNIRNCYSCFKSHLESFDWKGYNPENDNPHFHANAFNTNTHFNPQQAFLLLLNSQNSELIQWTRNSFDKFCDPVKVKALETFSTMPDWNTWIQDHYSLLHMTNLRYLDEPLQLTALKILLAQNKPEMYRFIKKCIIELGNTKETKFTQFQALESIIKKSCYSFFNLVPECTLKLDPMLQRQLYETIILHNQLYFYSLVEQWLSSSSTNDDDRRIILEKIASKRYKYPDGSIRTKPQEENRYSLNKEPKVGTLLSSEQDAKWYRLINYWLLRLPNNCVRPLIEKIEKNNIEALREIAQQRKISLESSSKIN